MTGSDRSAEEVLAIGEIVRPRGLRGELKVRLLCNTFEDFCECLDSAGEVFIWRERGGGAPVDPKQLQTVQVLSARFHDGCALIQLDGINSIEEAESLRNLQMGIRASQLPPLEEDSYYQFELEGLAVVDPQGNPVGTVEKVEDNPAHDQLRIRPPDPSGKVFRVPLVEAFVKQVDLEAGRIVVDLPAGLIEAQ